MFLLNDIITYVRRIVKTPSNAVLSDNLIIDYINRFWITDVDARMQLFDLKTKYQFMTSPGVDQYNMPLYDVKLEPGNQTIGMYPVYQGFVGPAYINGVQVQLQTQKQIFFNQWPNIVQNCVVVAVGDGGPGPYTLQFPIIPNIFPNPPHPLNTPLQGILRGHIDISGIISTGNNVDPPQISAAQIALPFPFIENMPVTSVASAVYFTATNNDGSNIVIADSGQFLQGALNYGLLMEPGNAPLGNKPLPGGYGSSFNITGITPATTTVLTITSNFVAGQTIQINGVGGMVELNGNSYVVLSSTPTTVTIDVDSIGFTAYTAGGIASSRQNMINYLTGEAKDIFFPSNIPKGANINAQCYYFQSGLPRGILYYNNTLTLRSPPSQQWLVELDAYLTPAAFLVSTQAIPFGYMAEYIARGAARKILSDTGDAEQLQFYEPLFREQELLVWKRSQRQWTSTRTETIYSRGHNQSGLGYNFGSGAI